METKTNVVLVHGAWADGSSWGKVISLLEDRGFNVTAAQLPLSSLEADITVTRNLLSEQKGPTVLVGHSYGGLVITEAGNNAPNVTALVYVAAFGLDEGESIASLLGQGPVLASASQIKPDSHGFLWIDRNAFAQAFAADVDPAEASIMAATQGPLSVSSFAAKCGPPAWKHLPSWYIVSTHDQMIPPQIEEMMAERMGAETRAIPSSHVSLVSHPSDVAEMIELAAKAGK